MDRESITLAIAIVGATTGVLGLVLSLLNTWRSFDRDQVKLRVQVHGCIVSQPVAGVTNLLNVTVVNTGYLPVTVAEIGFSLRNPRKHFLAFIPVAPVSDSIPKRLDPRTSMTVFVPPGMVLDEQFTRATKAFARTECGRVFRGSSHSEIKKFVRLIRKTDQT